MLVLAAFLFSSATAAAPSVLPPCQAMHLRLTADARNGEFNGMSHSGTELSVRNIGPDCLLPALPTVQFLDQAGHRLAAARKSPIGMHPGPAMVPIRLPGGHRATTDIRWISGPVFAHSRRMHTAAIAISLGGVWLKAPLNADLYGAAGKPVTFEQPPMSATEGLAED